MASVDDPIRAAGVDFVVLVNHKDVTGDFSPHLLSIEYTDNLKGQSDGLEVKLEDRAGLWLGPWYPVKGTTINASLGMETGNLLDCGEFQVDEIEPSGPPAEISIRCLATGVQNGLRTKDSHAYEDMNLRQLAQTIAAKQGLTIVGTVPEVRWHRRSQFRETDLGFLERVAWEHGFVFSVKGTKLIFHELEALEKQSPVYQVRLSDLVSYDFRDKVHAATGGAQASFFDLDSKQVITDLLKGQGKPPGDVLRIRKRLENHSHSKRLAAQALRIHKGWEREGTVVLPGKIKARAGVNLELVDFGNLNGIWQITQAKHSLARGTGYQCELNIREVSQ